MAEEVYIAPKRSIGGFTATVTIDETATDDLEITQHPVQQGAAISDHAYKKPTQLSIKAMAAHQQGGLTITELYQQLLDLQIERIPFDVVTGKRVYKNMLIRSISETTDRNTSQVLNIALQLQEVIIVQVVVTKVPPRARQKNPGRTGATEKAGEKKAIEETKQRKTSGLALIKKWGSQ